jgi:hypothetical protein
MNATTDLPRSQNIAAHAFIIAWVFSLAFYFLEYAVRSSPAVMIPQLAKSFGVSTLGVSGILLESAVLPLRPCRRVAVCPDHGRGHGLGRSLLRDR